MNKASRKNIISAIITLLILAGAFAISGMMASKKKSTVSDKIVKKERRTVKLGTFETTTQPNTIEIDGRLQAHDRVAITSKVQGIVQPQSTSIREGKYFEKGQLLFSIDRREATFNLKAQKSSLMTTITQMMPDLKFDYPASFDAWQNYLKGFSIDSSVKALPAPATEQEKYYVSGKNIYNQYYAIKGLETRLAEYDIYAPFSGVVTAVSAFPGALVSPSQSLATMINTSTYEIEAPVELQNLKYIKTGQTVQLKSDELDKTWSGRVSRIGSAIDPNTQNLPLYISVSGRGLKDGMYLKGELVGQLLDDVYKLPNDIFLTPNSIFVVQDSTLVSKEVVPVKRGEGFVLVKGLATSDRVVTGSLAGLFEGQKVNY